MSDLTIGEDDLELEDLRDLQDEPARAPRDPAALGYPPMLPVELALREKPVQAIVTAYGIDLPRWRELCADEVFKADLEARVIELKQDGMSFKLKARLQAEELLKTSWNLIHEISTPAAVKADLIKHTVRVAGLDASRDQGLGSSTAVGTALQININLGDK